MIDAIFATKYLQVSCDFRGTFSLFMMENKIEDHKEIIKHLQKRIQGHLKEKNALVEQIEQLEEDVETGFRIVTNSQNEMAQLRKEITEQKKKIGEKESELKEIEVVKKDLYEQKVKIKEMEMKKNISDKIIKNLQIEKNTLELQVEENRKNAKEKDEKLKSVADKQEEEVLKLVQEIELIYSDNKEKQEKLEWLVKENHDINEKLEILEEKNEHLKACAQTNETTMENMSICKELGMLNSFSQNTNLDCDPCSNELESRIGLGNHLEKLHENSSVKESFEMKLEEMKKKNLS